MDTPPSKEYYLNRFRHVLTYPGYVAKTAAEREVVHQELIARGYLTRTDINSILAEQTMVSNQSATIKPKTPLRFMTYNLLVAAPAFENDFKSIEPRYKYWSDPSRIRRRLIKAAVTRPDLMALQETTPYMLQELFGNNRPTDRYHYRYCERVSQGYGQAIVYDHSILNFVMEHCVQLIQNGTQVGLNAVFMDKRTDKYLCVTSLHLKAGDGVNEERRRHGEMIAAIDSSEAWLRQLFQVDIAHVIAGDLNSDRRVFYNPADKNTSVKGIAELKGYTDAFHSYKNGNFWTYYYWQKSVYDYVFVKGPVRVEDQNVPVSDTRSPNNIQGSDHLPVTCSLDLE